MKSKASNSQLIISEDGTLYHIHLKKSDNVPPNILIVGADSRVDEIASHFDEINFSHGNPKRSEFYTVAGTYKSIPITAMSIGIGTGPMDIAMNELHALFEYDHETDSWTKNRPNVNIIRVGTCGTSLTKTPVGALAISSYAIGLDNLGVYYPSTERKSDVAKKLEIKFLETPLGKINPASYCSDAPFKVVSQLIQSAEGCGESIINLSTGITTASPGFFGPEGRSIGEIKAVMSQEDFVSAVQSFNFQGVLKIENHEMETSAFFRLGHEHLGYNVGAICLVVDNLATGEVLTDSNETKKRMDICIRTALDTLVALSPKPKLRLI